MARGGFSFSTRAASCSASGDSSPSVGVTRPVYHWLAPGPVSGLYHRSITVDPLPTPAIGTLNEGHLHASLKRHYAEPGDAFEVPLHGFVIDLVRHAGTRHERLVEIQTGSFGAMGNKLDRLLEDHRMLLVHPIAVSTILERPGKADRRSPKRGSLLSVLDQLVSLPTMLDHPNLELDVVLHTEIKKQIHDPSLRRRRGGYRTVDRHLGEIVATHRFSSIADIAALGPPPATPTFTTADLAEHNNISRDAAQKLCYCLRAAGLFEVTGRTRAGNTFRAVRES